MLRQDLVFDLGFHKGQDSTYYLAKGFCVVGFEADPDLAKAARKTFAEPIATGALKLVEGAVVAPGSAFTTFYKNKSRSVWGTADPERAKINASQGAQSTPIVVASIDLKTIIAETGIPYFAKIDIEGSDHIALQVLLDQPVQPRFLSCESDKLCLDQVAWELDIMKETGFGTFQVVQQMFIPGRVIKNRSLTDAPLTHRFIDGASGPFGTDLTGPWLTRDQALERYQRIFREYRRWGDQSLARRLFTEKILDRVSRAARRALPGWYDTHAKWTG